MEVVDDPGLQAMAKVQDTLEQLVAGDDTCGKYPEKVWENDGK